MKEHIVLWTQGADNKGAFSLERGCLLPDSPSYNDFFNEFCQEIEVRRWDFSNDSVKVYYDGKKSVVSGYFNEVDDTDRLVTYTFLRYASDPFSTLDCIKALSHKIHYSVPADDEVTIVNALNAKARKLKTNRRLIQVASVALFFIAAASVICYCCNSCSSIDSIEYHEKN